MNMSIHMLKEERRSTTNMSGNPPRCAVNNVELWAIIFCLPLSLCYFRTLCFVLHNVDVISGETKYKPSTSCL